MSEQRSSSVKGLKDFFEQKSNKTKQEYVPKQAKSESPKPPTSVIKTNNDDDEFPNDQEGMRDLIQKLKYENTKLSYELRDAKNANNNMINQYQEMQSQQGRMSQLSQRNQELEQQTTALKARLMLAQEKLDEQESINLPKFQSSPQKEQIQKSEIGIQVSLISPIVEQNKLLLERLNEKPMIDGKELIIVNEYQSKELKAMMIELKSNLVSRLQYYMQLIQNKQLVESKQEIKSDLQRFHQEYLKMFRSINRPIENVNQIGRILSPIYEKELNDFLQSLSQFLDKFSQVSQI